jgi:hypothetical protein
MQEVLTFFRAKGYRTYISSPAADRISSACIPSACMESHLRRRHSRPPRAQCASHRTPRREPPAHPRQVLSSSPTSRRGQAKGKFSAEGRLQRASASPSGDPTRDLTMPAVGHRFESPQVHQEVRVNRRDFLRHRIPRHFSSLPRQGPVSVGGPAILRAIPGASCRKSLAANRP